MSQLSAENATQSELYSQSRLIEALLVHANNREVARLANVPYDKDNKLPSDEKEQLVRLFADKKAPAGFTPDSQQAHEVAQRFIKDIKPSGGGGHNSADVTDYFRNIITVVQSAEAEFEKGETENLQRGSLYMAIAGEMYNELKKKFPKYDVPPAEKALGEKQDKGAQLFSKEDEAKLARLDPERQAEILEAKALEKEYAPLSYSEAKDITAIFRPDMHREPNSEDIILGGPSFQRWIEEEINGQSHADSLMPRPGIWEDHGDLKLALAGIEISEVARDAGTMEVLMPVRPMTFKI